MIATFVACIGPLRCYHPLMLPFREARQTAGVEAARPADSLALQGWRLRVMLRSGVIVLPPFCPSERRPMFHPTALFTDIEPGFHPQAIGLR